MTDTTPWTGYAPVNGLQMYYEIHGTGQPLVLLHRALGAIDLWGPILETLAGRRQVIAVELQGHAHRRRRPSLQLRAAGGRRGRAVGHLGIAQADVAGYSMGGDTALRMASRHPERVRKLIAISAKVRYDGEYPEVLAGLEA